MGCGQYLQFIPTYHLPSKTLEYVPYNPVYRPGFHVISEFLFHLILHYLQIKTPKSEPSTLQNPSWKLTVAGTARRYLGVSFAEDRGHGLWGRELRAWQKGSAI